ncbi:hypothetical protein Tsp_12804 [Trichinella spiralis]|uniref:hypothetical protein n=1 Tax=Trichinella spiralis TaxID=6334 RepID=UPI0001EFEF62|nr:hypothetical protein Tsp_12804 [Trichinella spiralis]
MSSIYTKLVMTQANNVKHVVRMAKHEKMRRKVHKKHVKMWESNVTVTKWRLKKNPRRNMHLSLHLLQRVTSSLHNEEKRQLRMFEFAYFSVGYLRDLKRKQNLPNCILDDRRPLYVLGDEDEVGWIVA